MSYASRALIMTALLGSLSHQAVAQTTPAPNLATATIEDLMNIEITSAARKEQRAVDVAAAIFVITHDDIRASGMTTIPDLLRLVPGVDVAQINANKWAVSVRGFNGLRANKLLVLVDGRSVYNRIFAGVLWDAEDLMLDDVDRIEVIRGPGAAIWGANAVNGVINIVTKATSDTQGGLARVGAGGDGEQGAVRYGGTLGSTGYRVYSQWTGRSQSLIAPGTGADDGSHSVTAGFRADRTTSLGAVMLTGAFTAGQAFALWPNLDPQIAAREPIANTASTARGGSLTGRWTHARSSGGSLQVQASFDTAHRQEPVGDYDRHAVDVDVQYHTAIGAHQDLVTGAGYRFIGESLAGGVGFSLSPPDDDSSLLTALIQDEIALLGRRLAVTLGSQMQYDAYSGVGLQPTARVMWIASASQRFWAATSRALRTASLYERGIRVDFPPVPTAGGFPLAITVQGNPAASTETFVDGEGGYRLAIGTAASIDVTGFVGRYEHLRTQEQAAPAVLLVPSPHVLVTSTIGNRLAATSRGVEVTVNWTPAPAWRFGGSYTAFHLSPHPETSTLDPAAASEDGSAPAAQWQVRSTFAPPGQRGMVNVAIFHVGPLVQAQVDGYTRADIGVEWRLTSRLSAMAIGQNLFNAAHAEYAGAASLVQATQVPRSVGLRLRWTSR